ncbi:MAG: pilus assembly protein TadG-related protein [Gemmatimonadota bacterium]
MYRHHATNPRGNERGATVVVVALAMTGLLSVVALAVDVGMLLTARTEAQRAADAGALAGAAMLITNPGADLPARQEARLYAQLNTVQNQPVQVDLNEDIDVDLANERVTVRVRRDDLRGGPVATWFARIFGVDVVDIAAVATAETDPAGSAACVKPFTIYDKFDDRNDNGVFDPGIDEYDPATTGYGSSWRNPGEPGDDGQGYINDLGFPIVLKGNAKDGDPCCPGTGPSWYYPWAMPDPDGGSGRGASAYRANIAACNPSLISIGVEYDVEPGNMNGPTRQGVEELISQDPFAQWDPLTNQVVGSDYTPWHNSPRIGIVPVFNPSREFDPGRKPIEFSGFLAVFFERVTGNGNNQKVEGRILYSVGIGGQSGASGTTKYVHLVQ